jgi:hypothetical protein
MKSDEKHTHHAVAGLGIAIICLIAPYKHVTPAAAAVFDICLF